jgi:hypothetical protein
MHLFLLILALSGLFITNTITAPTDFPLSAPLAIPDPNSRTCKADLAAAVSYARTHPVPATNTTTLPNKDKTSTVMKAAIATTKNKQCGMYTNIAGHFSFPTYTTEAYCNDTEDFEEMDRFWNWYCRFCIVFDGKSNSASINDGLEKRKKISLCD